MAGLIQLKKDIETIIESIGFTKVVWMFVILFICGALLGVLFGLRNIN